MKSKATIIAISTILVLVIIGVGFYFSQKRQETINLVNQNKIGDNKAGEDNGENVTEIFEEDNPAENGFRTFFNNQKGYKFKYPEYCKRNGESTTNDSGFVLNCVNESNNFNIMIKSYDSMINCSSDFCSSEISNDTIRENTAEDYKKTISSFKNIQDNKKIKGFLGNFETSDGKKFMSGIYFDCEESMACSIEILGNKDKNSLDDSILDNITSSFEIIDSQTVDELYR